MNPCHCLNPHLICMDFYSVQFHSQFGSIIAAPNPNFIVCSLTMEMGPLNISSPPNTGKVLLVEDSRKTLAEEKTLLPSSLCFLVNVLHHMQLSQCPTSAGQGSSLGLGSWSLHSFAGTQLLLWEQLPQHPAHAMCITFHVPRACSTGSRSSSAWLLQHGQISLSLSPTAKDFFSTQPPQHA